MNRQPIIMALLVLLLMGLATNSYRLSVKHLLNIEPN